MNTDPNQDSDTSSEPIQPVAPEPEPEFPFPQFVKESEEYKQDDSE